MVKLNTSYEVPVGSEFFTLYYVKLALYVVTSVHPAKDRFGPGSRSVPVAGCGRVVVSAIALSAVGRSRVLAGLGQSYVYT